MASLKDTTVYGNLSVTGIITNSTLIGKYTWTGTIASGSTKIIDVSTIKSGSTCNTSVIQVWVQDTESGSVTIGKYINAHAITTVVSDGNNFTVYNDHTSTQTFKINILCF